MDKIKFCRDCGKELNSPSNSEFCHRCLAIWHLDHEIPDDTPCADFDEVPDYREEY